MNTFTVPNFEPKKRFEYNTGPIGLKALLVSASGASENAAASLHAHCC
jgi:hypothetical protein